MFRLVVGSSKDCVFDSVEYLYRGKRFGDYCTFEYRWESDMLSIVWERVWANLDMGEVVAGFEESWPWRALIPYCGTERHQNRIFVKHYGEILMWSAIDPFNPQKSFTINLPFFADWVIAEQRIYQI